MREGTGPCMFGVDSEYVELAAEVFGLLSDPTRIRIILALRAGELSVNRLAEIVDKSPTAVSQHLAKLRMGRMVTTRREGNQVFYALADEHARTLVSQAVFQAEHAVEGSPVHHHVRMADPPPSATIGAATECAACEIVAVESADVGRAATIGAAHERTAVERAAHGVTR